ncbi:MAG: hypothetical protein ABIG44_15165 [Planctomycetota bacterium]
MMPARRALLLILAIYAADAWGQVAQREPHIGYLYPGGGRLDTVTQIQVGGQFLRGASDVYISGEGVHAKVIKHYPPLRNLDQEQRIELRSRMRAAFKKRWAELAKDGQVSATPPWRELGLPGPGMAGKNKQDKATEEPVELPPHPLLDNIADMSIRELLHLRHILQNFRKRQQNAQIGETVVIEVTIDDDAIPGDRELRLGTRQGLTNPMVFQVGALPEIRELEPNVPVDFKALPKETPHDLPILINGQIMPGDIDRFRFHAEQGQELVITASARRLIPYLADAVPGWFQATLVLYDAKGNEVAYADDYRFDPDPVLFHEVPQDGEYELAIRDSIYRGREDFVYRISISEQPFITSAFPLGARTGKNRYVTIEGWNLSTERLLLDAKSDADGVRQKTWGRGKRSSNPVTYALDTLPSINEKEDNNSPAQAQRITLPIIVNGRVVEPGDVDVFQFKGRDGDVVVAEVMARRLYSPLDSLLRLTDESGRVLAWNDDYEHKDGFLHTDMGLLTHHADSYLRAQLPADGTYCIQLTDALSQGGAAYGYRLRIGPPQPDFALYLTPSSINARAGQTVPISLHILRKDGFNGAVDLFLQDATRGFKLEGARIPAGRDCVRMTLRAPRRRFDKPVVLQLEGRAKIGERKISRPVIPAENMMQAFLYRHIAPSQELMFAIIGGKGAGSPVELSGDIPVRLPTGGSAQVQIKVPGRPELRDIELELNDPPKGITLQDVTLTSGTLAFVLQADGTDVKPGYADNLIVEAFMDVERPQRGQEGAKKKQRVSVGFLPAIPIEVVSR